MAKLALDHYLEVITEENLLDWNNYLLQNSANGYKLKNPKVTVVPKLLTFKKAARRKIKLHHFLPGIGTMPKFYDCESYFEI